MYEVFFHKQYILICLLLFYLSVFNYFLSLLFSFLPKNTYLCIDRVISYEC